MTPFDERRRDPHFGEARPAGGDSPFRDASSPERSFPSESEWLDLPLPPPSEFPLRSAHDFADRVLHALHDEAALDAQLDAVDRELPRELLHAHEVPEPMPGFVARTMAAARDDRRTHWHHLLARYVAPEPSPQFVARTVAALRADADVAGTRGTLRRLVWPLLAAAAALAMWSVLTARSSEPLELRLADHVPPAFAHAYSSSPLATVLAVNRQAAEPDSLAAVEPDGVYLLLGGAR